MADRSPFELSRRHLLAGGMALAGSACTTPGLLGAASGSNPQSLKALARRSGRRFGSAYAWGAPGADRGSFANPAYAAILEQECELLVPENELKWQWTRPSATASDFRQMDAMVAYATANNFGLRGHTLFWAPEKWYPEWLVKHDFGPRPASAAAAMLTEHVRTVCRRYGTSIMSYDVVNEAVQPETGQIRDTVVTRALGGEAFLDLMFRTAKAEARGIL